MSKKLLKESQVRRFMGLAGMRAHTVSNYLKENTAMYEEEPEPDAEFPPEGDELPPEGGEDLGELPPDDLGAEEDGEEASADVDPDAIESLRQAFEEVMAPLEAALPGGEEGGELEEPMGGEELPPADLEGEEDIEGDLQDAGAELEEPTEDEVVQEVARRVAKRILTAKRAQDKMNEALGKRRKPQRTAKPTMRRRRPAPKRTPRRRK